MRTTTGITPEGATYVSETGPVVTAGDAGANMDWITDNEPVGAFDFNKNGQIDFNDIVIMFNEL